jgi:hypothetical protein
MTPNTANNPVEPWRSDDADQLQLDSGEERAHQSTVKSVRKTNSISQYVVPQLDFRYRVAFALAEVPEVEAVFTSEYGKVFFVWTIVRERTQAIYERLYEREQQLIGENEPVQFDFTIMASRGRDPRTIITDPMAQIAYLRQ